MISRKYKTLFIHIHKTAGSSIEQKLGLYNTLYKGAQDHRTIVEYEKIATEGKTYALKNSLYSFRYGNYKKGFQFLCHVYSPELTQEEYNSFFKFSIVRNSWSRLYSYYTRIIKDDVSKKRLNISDDCTLFEFIKDKVHSDKFNQLRFLTDSKGNIPMDFIGRFENLNADFNYVCRQLNIPDPELPKLLISNNDHYSNHFDDKTKDLVYKLYKNEIDYFNFNFGE